MALTLVPAWCVPAKPGTTLSAATSDSGESKPGVAGLMQPLAALMIHFADGFTFGPLR
jgi:hypothetical protein